MKILQMPKPWQIGLVLAIGVFGMSTTAIFVRLSLLAASTHSIGFSLLLSAARLSISALLLVPAWQNLRSSAHGAKAIYYALAAGICLALHFATWITSLSFTSIAASSALVSSTPIWVALFSWLWFRDKLSFTSILGIGIASFGGALIASGGSSADAVVGNALLGNALALFGAWMCGFYLLLGHRAQKEGLGLSSYVLITYGTGALILLPLPGLLGTAYAGYPAVIYVYMALIAVLSQIIGHTSLNWATRHLPPTIVALATLFEPVVSSLLGYVFLDEIPGITTIVGAIVVLTGVACVIIGNQSSTT